MSIVVIGIILLFMWLLIEVLSVVLKMTGLDLQKSRFQVISMITHTGFTTRESELIAQHPLRRKIASILMVLSYVAQVTLISLLVNMLTKSTLYQVYGVALLLVMGVGIYLLTRTKYLSTRFNRFVEKIVARNILKQDKQNIDQIFKISPGYGIYEMILDDSSPLCGVTLEDAQLNQLSIHVLKVDTGSMVYDFPNASLQLQLGDRLILYGRKQSVMELALTKVA